jgi:hypothetical protein
MGSLAALGCRTAVAKLFGVKLSGFAAWFLWRSIYLFKMPGWSRRLRIAIDWTLDLLFRRDYVQLGLHRPGRETAPDAAAAGRRAGIAAGGGGVRGRADRAGPAGQVPAAAGRISRPE